MAEIRLLWLYSETYIKRKVLLDLFIISHSKLTSIGAQQANCRCSHFLHVLFHQRLIFQSNRIATKWIKMINMTAIGRRTKANDGKTSVHSQRPPIANQTAWRDMAMISVDDPS
jgi:hypothetical protein